MAIKIPIISDFNSRGVKDAESAFGKLGGVAKKSALALGGAAIAGAAIATKLALAGEEAATANARIEQIATSMGIFGEGTENSGTSVKQLTDRLTKLAEATAMSTGVDQNQIKLTQAKLLTFKELATTADEVGGAFDRATAAAVDMSAAGFGDAASNAVQLGKALNDPVKGITALSRSGITFTAQQKKLIESLVATGRAGEAQNMILEAIEMQVGGTAEATANASDKMKVAFSILQERIGTKLLPVFNKLSKFVIDKLIPGIEKFVAVFEKDGNSFVWVVNDNVVKSKKIETNSLISEGNLGIIHGIQKGDQVVMGGLNLLTEGETIRIVKRQSKTNVGNLL